MSSYDIDLPDDWSYGAGVLHGGWLVSTVAEVALREVEHPHPLATSAHFVSAARVGPAVVDVEVLRAGRSVSSVRARLRQDDTVRVEVLLSAGRLQQSEPYWSRGDEPPVLEPVDECTRSAMPEGAPRNGIVEQMDLRYDVDVWTGGGSGRAEVAAWMRLASG
ncbi:MAG: thioesterase family protein, partial [Actinobacteria bacterium]|nr:thioesterase family protein [Actinomycetota bacterium]